MNAGAMTLSILVIDDDPLFNDVLCRALLRRGYAASGARTIAEALALAEQMQPQMIVLDLNLADVGGSMSGLTLVAPLKRTCPESSIVVLTGYASIATAVEAIKLGATHYLAKPVDVDTLLAAFSATLPEIGHAGNSPPSAPLSVQRMEWEHIQRILLEHNGNISATARALNMHRRTLQRKLGKRPVKS